MKKIIIDILFIVFSISPTIAEKLGFGGEIQTFCYDIAPIVIYCVFICVILGYVKEHGNDTTFRYWVTWLVVCSASFINLVLYDGYIEFGTIVIWIIFLYGIRYLPALFRH